MATAAAPEREEPEAAELSLRDEIDAAFEQHATDETPEAEPRVTQREGRERDGLGRFARKGDPTEPPAEGPEGTAKAAQAPTGTPAPPAIPAAPQPPETKAPASWTPAARELWAQVPEGVRSEIHRREVEAQRVLQETAQVRNFAGQFMDVVRPYEMFIRSENSTPLQAVQSLMQTAAEMRVGTPAQKVNIVAGIIQQHGVDLKLLDDALASLIQGGGQGGAAQGNSNPQQFRDPRVDLLLAQRQQESQQQSQFEQQAIEQGLAAFAETHEFMRDVAPIMADLIDHATRAGQSIDLEKIYARACQIDENVSSILAQRAHAAPTQPQQRSSGAGGPSQAVLRARRAAVSVKGDPNPEGSTVPKDDSVRGAIEAAFDAHSG